MTFTYNGTLTTDLDYIRFKIQDTVENSGIKPNGGNFTDEEIAGLLGIESTANRTIAAIYETLASIYANYVDSRMDIRDEKLSQKAARFTALAKQLREQYGFTVSSVSTSFVTRVDGYSDDIDSGEVDNTFYRDRWWE